MDNKLLVKTIASCVVGAVLWCIIDLVMCTIRNTNFVDTFFSPENIIELVFMMTLSGYVYYTSRKNKRK